MVIVKDYHLREGETENYVTLELEGDIEMVQSQNTGRFYATARKCCIFSTFDEDTAIRMVGTKIAGQIIRVPCEPIDYKIPHTGEVIKLTHRWDYIPEEETEFKSKKKIATKVVFAQKTDTQ